MNESQLTWALCSGVEDGFGVLGREPPEGVPCRSRARAVRRPSVTRLFGLSPAEAELLSRPSSRAAATPA